MTTELMFQKEVMDKFDEINKKIDYWQRDMDEIIKLQQEYNQALRNLLEALKK